MAETSVHGAMHRRSSGDRPNRTEGNRPPPPPPLSPRDLISTLPDAVIHHIFSFLPLEDVVKTSVLSKRWRSTWTTTTHLIFNRFRPHNNHAYSLDFPSIVNRVLTQCTSPTVKEFHVNSFEYDEADRLNLNCWLDFAAKHGVEDLRLGLTPQLPFVYVLPPFLYCLSELVRLHVSGCRFSLGTSIEWPCLKVLFIGSAELSDEILEGIFRGSPVLESLDLGGCWGVRNIVIDSTSVKRLVLSSSSVEKIWAPHLLSLWVSGTQYLSYLRGWQSPLFRLDDVSSLVEVKLYFELPYDVYDSEEKYCDMLKGLLEKLRGVPKITIDNYCLQILSLLEMKGVPSPLPKCQNLILHAPVSQWYLPGIAYMLRSSQCLEKLVIHLNGFSDLKLKLEEESKERFDFDEEDFLCSLKGNFQCLAKHLKRVEIIGYEANSFVSKHLLALIKFLLGDALMLEKMMIKADLCTWHGQEHLQATVPSELLAFRRNLLSYQRASKNAEVIFN